MLVNGEVTGQNFLSEEICEYARFRTKFRKNGETIDEYRLYNNMLGSQTMCFNLFFPLKQLFDQDVAAATKIFAACFPSLSIDKLLGIEIEFFPYPKDEYLNDQTAFDAMILFRDKHGNRCILAIETKYREELGSNPSRDLGPQIQLAKSCGLFNDNGIKRVSAGMPQLGRNFLLALKYAEVHKLDKAYAVVISPHENSSSAIEIADFCGCFLDATEPRVFYESLEAFVSNISKNCPRDLKTWIGEFYSRYLDFGPLSMYIDADNTAPRPSLIPNLNEVQAAELDNATQAGGKRSYAQHLDWLNKYNAALRAKGLPEVRNKRYKEDPNYKA